MSLDQGMTTRTPDESVKSGGWRVVEFPDMDDGIESDSNEEESML